MPRLTVFVFTLIAAIVLLASAGTSRNAHAAHLINGSFESGLTGWTPVVPAGGFVNAVPLCSGFVPIATGLGCTPAFNPLAPYAPFQGSLFALLSTNGPGSFSTLSQTLTVVPGDVISGRAFFGDSELAGETFFCDSAAVRILSGATTLATPFSANSCATPASASTPWTAWTFTATTAGAFTIEARIANGGDLAIDSVMGLDDVVIIHAPTATATATTTATVTATAVATATPTATPIPPRIQERPPPLGAFLGPTSGSERNLSNAGIAVPGGPTPRAAAAAPAAAAPVTAVRPPSTGDGGLGAANGRGRFPIELAALSAAALFFFGALRAVWIRETR